MTKQNNDEMRKLVRRAIYEDARYGKQYAEDNAVAKLEALITSQASEQIEKAKLKTAKILLAGAGGRIDVARTVLKELPEYGYSIVNWTDPTTDAEVYELRIDPALHKQASKDTP